MSKMYEIKRSMPYNHPHFPGNVIGSEKCHGFEKAKKAMRKVITEKYADCIEIFTNKIDEYCQIYYPDNTPAEFEKLKGLIVDFMSDPTFPKSQEQLDKKYGWFSFQDGRIWFEFRKVNCNFFSENDEEAIWTPMLHLEINYGDYEMFLQGDIDCFIMEELPDPEKYSPMYNCMLTVGWKYGMNIDLTALSDDDNNDVFEHKDDNEAAFECFENNDDNYDNYDNYDNDEIRMKYVYVLSGRDWIANSDWGTGSEISVFGVYSDLEKAKIAFKDKVLEIAKNLADTEDEDEFKYTDETLFESFEAKDDAFGWEYKDFGNSCRWELCLPENNDYNYGCWFLPNAKLIRYEIK